MERIDIQNNGKVPRHYNLPHQQVCIKSGRCICDHKTGACASLHILANSRARNVDSVVLFAEDVREAVENNSLLVYVSKREVAQPQQKVAEQKQKKTKPAGSRKAAHKKGTSKE